jgi:hypothetical protein
MSKREPPYHVRETAYPALGFVKQAEDLWRIVDRQSEDAPIGPLYKSRSELLADLVRFAGEYGCAPAAAPNLMNGIRVYARRGNVIFIPLPRALWGSAGTCSCRFCSEDPKHPELGYWDTLAVVQDLDPLERRDTTWTVHYPEAHGIQPKRSSE